MTSTGSIVGDRGNRKFFDHEGRKWDVRYSDELFSLPEWKAKSIGHYTFTGNVKDEVLPEPAFTLRLIPKMMIGDLEVAAATHYVCEPGLRKLTDRFPNPILTESNMRAFIACVKRDFPGLSIPMVTDTVNFFMSRTYIQTESVLTKKNLNLIKESNRHKGPDFRSFTQPSTLGVQKLINSLGETIDHGEFFRKYGIPDTKDVDETNNGSFEVISSRGWTSTEPDDKTCIRGKFDTPENLFPKFYKTQAMGLKGENDFQILDNSGENIVKAMSRLYKARGDEGYGDDTQLRNNQAGLVAHILMMTPGQDLHKGSIDPEIDFNFKTVSNSRKICSDKVKEYKRAHSTVGDQYLGDLLLEPGNMATYGPLARQVCAEVVTGFTTSYLHAFSAALPLALKLAFSAAFMYFATDLYYKTIFVCLFSAYFARRQYAQRPGFSKTKLYMSWWAGITDSFGHTYSSGDCTSLDAVEGKLKFELGKPNKNGRIFVSYGRSILYAGWIYEIFKKVVCGMVDLTAACEPGLERANAKGETGRFVVDIFKSLEEGEDFEKKLPSHGLYCRIFSDDKSSVYTTATGERIYFDTDISSCDAGNTFAMFYILGFLLHAYKLGKFVKVLFSRLKAVITIRNPSKRGEFVKIKPVTLFEGSGCPETTAVNDVASLMIAISMWVHINASFFFNTPGGLNLEDKNFEEMSQKEREWLLCYAAAAVGHKITVDWRDGPSNTQFLKYSPLLNEDGVYVNTRNLGTIFRSLGTWDGDITPKMVSLSKKKFDQLSNEQKSERFIQGVVNGLKNEPGNVVIDALRARFSNSAIPEHHLAHHTTLDATNRSHHRLPVTSLQERYGGEQWEWTQLAERILAMSYGRVSPGPMLSEIYNIDYGLPLFNDKVVVMKNFPNPKTGVMQDVRIFEPSESWRS